MRSAWLSRVVVAVCAALAGPVSAQSLLGTGFTYQGKLEQSGASVNGPVAMEFRLWDDPVAGAPVGPTLVFDGLGGNPAPVDVADGLFTVTLDFGAGAFGSNAVWLEITVDGVTLSPRQAATPAPAALFSSAPWATNGSSVSYTGGNVGIGTTLPNTALEVSRISGDTELGLVGGDGGRRWTLQSSSGADEFLAGTFQIIDRTDAAARLVIDGQGRVGIGTSYPLATLSVGGDSMVSGNASFGGPGGTNFVDMRGTLYQNGTFNQTGTFSQSGIAQMSQLGLNTVPDPSTRLHVVGDVRIDSGNLRFGSPSDNSDPIYIYRANPSSDYSQLIINIGDNPGSNAPPGDDLLILAGGQTQFIFRSNGDAAKTGAPIWSTVSDERAKHDIEPLTGTGVLDRLMKLKGHTFYYNEPNKPGTRPGQCIGFVAQEVEPFFPTWVSTDRDGMKSLAVTGFDALTVEALRDLRAEKNAEIESLRRENTELADRVSRLEAMVEALSQR